MSVRMQAFLIFAMVYSRTVLYGVCLCYLSALPTVFYQLRLTSFPLFDLNWLLNLTCFDLYFAVVLLLETFTSNI